MQLLRLFESLRTPFLDGFFSLITHLGAEEVFMLAGLAVLWCIDKKWGFRFFFIGLTGSIVNQFLKALFLIPRPWVADETFTIVESAREGASGYSFPSGHTQSAVCVFGTLVAWRKKRWISIVCVLAIFLTALSRMHLGVHTPLDVGASLVTGAITVIGFVWLFERFAQNRRAKIIIGLLVLALNAALAAYVFLAPAQAGNVAAFDMQGQKAACTLFGTTLGFLLAWLVDDRHTHFEVKALWWAQIIKYALGLGFIMGVRLGLKPVLQAVLGDAPFTDAVRYFFMALVGGTLWPMTFPLWAKLGKSRAQAAVSG